MHLLLRLCYYMQQNLIMCFSVQDLYPWQWYMELVIQLFIFYQCHPYMVNVSFKCLIKPSDDLLNLNSFALCDQSSECVCAFRGSHCRKVVNAFYNLSFRIFKLYLIDILILVAFPQMNSNYFEQPIFIWVNWEYNQFN